ncbi:MFS transporter [Granulicoccus phenolivorans]|uniref:MFS transporter n=1 Tax=Granulicoccus phenolivorans TaxID=266854 RepID=UPI0009DC469B|nr:MFS transporter [Granulicoccus phenolivorans]
MSDHFGVTPTPDVTAEPLADPAAVNRAIRPAPARMRTFTHVLINTGLAGITTSYLWFALTFWIYLRTRNVIATGVVGGAFMLLMAATSISFGTLVDRHLKLVVMRASALVTLGCFLAALLIYRLGGAAMTSMTQPWLWLFAVVILLGAVVENLRNIALATTVTILVDPDRRANANGAVGTVQGVAFMVTSLLSGLSIGFLGMGGTLVVAVGLVALALVHLLALRMPEEVRPAATDATGHFDLRGSIRAVRGVPGLFSLILFSTFNNLLGGGYLALLDPYGLEMFSVQVWGTVYAVTATGFIGGGILVARVGLGPNPLRTMLLAVVGMGLIGVLFTLREWPWLFIAGIWVYMMLTPAVEAAEQTVIQRVVPLARQGRVFGFAGAFEASAAPITAFLLAPLAQLWIIPWAAGPEGARTLAPLLGYGAARGIALIFLVTGLLMMLAAALALLSPVYRRVSAAYRELAAAPDPTAPGTGGDPQRA